MLTICLLKVIIMNLTKPKIEKLPFTDPSTPAFYWDDVISGFGVKVGARSKTYIFQGRVGRKSIRIKIANVNDMRLDEAKEKAKKYAVQCNEGINPLHEKAKKISAADQHDLVIKKQNIRFREAWEVYLAENKPNWRERSYKDHIDMARGGRDPINNKEYKPQPIFELLDLKLSELTRDVFIDWILKNADRNTSLLKSFRLTRAFLNWCEDDERYCEIIPKDSYNSKRVKKLLPKPQAKKDCLLKEQLEPWFKEMSKIKNEKVSFLFNFSLITGARKNEILALKWTDIDFKWKTIKLNDKVEDTGRIIPLTEYIETNLKKLRKSSDSIFVFSSDTSESGQIVNPYKDFYKARDNLQIDITIHGLRRSFETLSGWINLPKGITHQISGHKADSITERHYTVRPMDMLRMHMQSYENWILEEAKLLCK